MNTTHGFVRVSTAVPRVAVADPVYNTSQILELLSDLADSDVVVFPELAVSAYTCGDLFHQKRLLDETAEQLERIAREAANPKQLILVGAPLRHQEGLYNCCVAINNRRIIGVVPKQFLPNYKEFYEQRWFASGTEDLAGEIDMLSGPVPFGTQLLFTAQPGKVGSKLVVAAEICEAIWMPVPPSSMATIAGANLICNLSASNETVGKADYRRNLVVGQSGRCIAAYAYTSCGPTESTSDVVYGGHAMIAEAGHLLEESTRVGDTGPTRRDSYAITADVDIEKLQTERRTTTSFVDSRRYLPATQYQEIRFELQDSASDLKREITAKPFVPASAETLHQRCAEVFGIQTAALAKRLECLGSKPSLSIGVSGGLDSTLSLLVATKTCDMLGLPRSVIQGVTMPGFGTTGKTLKNARDLMRHLGVTVSEIDIREACLMEFRDLAAVNGYQPFGQIDLATVTNLDDFVERIQQVPVDQRKDLTFENVQARRRTELLMNLGFVLGTGDMSEMWLGWCTYNADHQSMYNVNCSVPKTLVRFLVEYVAEHEFDSEVRETLLSVAATEISPELLPPDSNGEIAQSTEETVGPYELHDFFMFHLTRSGFTPSKVLYLARHASGWSRDYTDAEIKHWLETNLRRAFSQQYKRDDVPNGPKVGSVSLSPRGDWRMPSDASVQAWLRDF
ncbi:MAG: NAD(+) synthase [Gammaproteobacteria bacterium]|nr:NAD(+) synthase [Gammaproteobacteria bacterium]